MADHLTDKRLGRIYKIALQTFSGDQKATQHWLVSPAFGLGDKIPLDLARTEAGAKQVENLLGRIEDGVFS